MLAGSKPSLEQEREEERTARRYRAVITLIRVIALEMEVRRDLIGDKIGRAHV